MKPNRTNKACSFNGSMELCWDVALWLPLASGSSSQKVWMLPETRPPCIRDCSSQLLLFGFSRGGNRFKVWRHCYGILLGFWLYYCRLQLSGYNFALRIHILLQIQLQIVRILLLPKELTAVYPLLSPPNLTMAASNRVCSVLALLQCVAADPNTKKAFMDAYIPFYLDPLVGTTSQERPFEHLRLSSLGIIGAMVKEDDPKVISFLLDTGIMSLCLRGMEIGSELSKTVAIFIVQKIVSDNAGLAYICSKPEQFYSLSDHLRSVVEYLSQQQQPSQRMLTHILRCYLRLTDDPRACTELQTHLPGVLRDASLGSNINDEATTSLLQELLHKVYG